VLGALHQPDDGSVIALNQQRAIYRPMSAEFSPVTILSI
jgi:hypothetical protein